MIHLPRHLFDEVVAHALATYPNEACGVVAGSGGAAIAVYPVRNAARSPVAYRFDEREQLEVFSEIEEKGWDLFAFFHSHTASEAYPSRSDVELAHWRDPVSGATTAAYPETRYLIVSLAGPDGPVARAFRFHERTPVEEELVVS